MTNHVSDEQLLTDIHNTRDEREAYYHLRKGYLILSKLPENSGDGSHIFNSKKYFQLQEECDKFLQFLENLAKERELVIDK